METHGHKQTSERMAALRPTVPDQEGSYIKWCFLAALWGRAPGVQTPCSIKADQ